MLRVYTQAGGRLELSEGPEKVASAIWFDLLNPDQEEIATVKSQLPIEIPTRAEMEEIELSSRLYTEDNGLFRTVTVLAQLDTESPLATPVTLILAGEFLVLSNG